MRSASDKAKPKKRPPPFVAQRVRVDAIKKPSQKAIRRAIELFKP